MAPSSVHDVLFRDPVPRRDPKLLVRQVDLTPFDKIELQGGEPLALKIARRFFDPCAEPTKKVSFLTNGLLINSTGSGRKIALHSEMIMFSINAASKDTHERINVGSSWERVMSDVELCRDRDELGRRFGW